MIALRKMLLVLIASVLCAGVAPAQDTPAPTTPSADPTTPSDEFREIANLLREADRVKKVLSDNERLQKQVSELLLQNKQLTDAVEAAQADNAKLAIAVKDVLKKNDELTEQKEKLESTLGDVSQVKLQGLLLSVEGSSKALLDIAGTLRVVGEGDRLSVAVGADRHVGQTILIKEITEKGVHLEMGNPARTVIIN